MESGLQAGIKKSRHQTHTNSSSQRPAKRHIQPRATSNHSERGRTGGRQTMSTALSAGPNHTAVFVCAADRGHFVWSLPLAVELLATSNSIQQVEYWVNDEAVHWVEEVADIRITVGGTFGRFPRETTDVYTELMSFGDSDAQGIRHCAENIERITAERALEFSCCHEDGKRRLSDRLLRGGVAVVVLEWIWCSWAADVASAANVPSVPFNPSFVNVYRQEVAHWTATRTSDGAFTWGRPDDLVTFDWGPPGMVYPLAECLRREVHHPRIRCIGAILPCGPLPHTQRTRLAESELGAWLSTDGQPRVIFCSLGSHMLARVLPLESVAELIRGVIDAGFRLVMVVPEGIICQKARVLHDVCGVVETCRLETWVDQRALLAHGAVVCFLSHCGSNSTHECLAAGLPMVALPFFDDQYYIANALVAQGAAVSLQKGSLTRAAVTDAVTRVCGQSSFRVAAGRLQQAVIGERGLESAVEAIVSEMQHAVR